MKKTVNVSLGGYAFQIEDDAYDRLDRYLEGVKRRFASYPDASEIIDDIEARMGEKLMAQHGVGQILALPVIEALITEMGNAEEIDEDKENTAPAGVPSPKRFFRDPDDTIIAGVASGLAAYFGIDPMWPRLIFAISIFFGGFGIVAYLILWLIIPQAKTGLEKAQMRGQPFNLDEFERNVKERIARIKAEEGPHLKRAGEGLAGFFREVGQRIGRMVGFLGKTFFKIIGAIISIGASMALAMVVFASVTLLVNRESPYVDIGIALPLSPALAILMVASIAIVIAVPLFFLILIGSSLVSGQNKFTKMVGLNLLALWVLGLIGAGNFAIRYAPQIRDQVEQRTANKETRPYAERDFSGVKVSGIHRVRIVKSETFSVSALGNPRDLEMLEIKARDGILSIDEREPWKICVFCWREAAEVTVKIPELSTLRSSGATRVEIEGFEGAQTQVDVSGASRINISGTFSSLELQLSGASRATFSGNITALDGKLSGASRLEIPKGRVQSAKLDLSGASRASLDVVETLSVKASGASRVTYSNDPRITRSDLSGSSSIRRNSGMNEEEYEFDLEGEQPPMLLEPPAPIAPRTGSGGTR